jgi:hypothetical protein
MSSAIVPALMQRATEITRDMSEIEVVSLLLLQLSCDPQLHQQFASHWMSMLFQTKKSTVERLLTQRINSLLTARIAVEVVYVTDRGRDYGILYLFGREFAIFGIPMDMLRTNFIAIACITRLVAQGHVTEGKRAFNSYRRSVANTESVWSQFSENKVVELQLERAPFVTAIVSHLCSVALRMDTVSAIKKHSETTRLLISAALTQCLSQIFGSEKPMHQYPWLDATCANELYALRELCLSKKTFTAFQLDEFLLEQYARICKNQI